MEIVLILLAFIALLLLMIWRPFFKQEKTQQHADIVAVAQNDIREQTNIGLYHEHKAEIEKDFNEGGIDDESYQFLIAELDNSLLQDVETTPKTLIKPDESKAFGVIWPIALSLFILVFSISLYLEQGSLENLMITPLANHNTQQSMSAEQQAQAQQQQMLDYINNMQRHLTEQPDDSEAWYNLGQTYVSTGEFELAINALQQVVRIEGEHADLLGAIAQASYYKNNQQIDAQVQNLIDKALALDINDPSTNILLGMHNFISQEYSQAISYWQRVIDDKRQGVNITALQEAVNEAKNRLDLPVEEKSLESEAVTGPNLTVSVSLSTDIAETLAKGEDKVVFVYALPTNGKRMPLAAIKLKASDLPTVVNLNNSQAMSPQNNLSSVDQVHIFAIVSKLGGVGIKPGDFKGEIQNIAVNNESTLSLEINSLVE